MDAVRAILVETGGHNAVRYDRSYWDWQYRQLPTGLAHVHVAWHGDRIVGYYHMPIYDAVIDGRAMRIGNIQDVAMLADHRRQGGFRQLAECANAEADASPEVDLIYTFPNARSIHTFLKYNGYQRLLTYPTHVMPLDAGAMLGRRLPLLGHAVGAAGGGLLKLLRRRPRMSGSIAVAHEPDAAMAAAFMEHAARFRCCLHRDLRWLQWRYARSPRGKHWFVASYSGAEVLAAVVVKADRMFGSPALIIMDMAHRGGAEEELLALVATLARDHRALIGEAGDLIFYAGQAPVNARLGGIGFLAVPERFNPRPLNLLVRDAGGAKGGSFADPSAWLVGLGDWDVL